MTVTQQQLVLTINVPQEQVESIVALYPEGTAKPTFHLLSTTHYLNNREHPEPSLILLKLDSAGLETSGIAEAISESPHPLILIYSGGHYCSSWWRPTYPQLRDCLPDRDNERISTAILRELETLELRNKLKKKQFRLNNISQGLNSIVSNGHEAAALIHNGQYLKVNKAYRKLFAFNPEQSIHEIIVPKVFSELESPHHSLGPPCNKNLKTVH